MDPDSNMTLLWRLIIPPGCTDQFNGMNQSWIALRYIGYISFSLWFGSFNLLGP